MPVAPAILDLKDLYCLCLKWIVLGKRDSRNMALAGTDGSSR